MVLRHSMGLSGRLVLLAAALLVAVDRTPLRAAPDSPCDCYVLTAWSAKDGIAGGNVLSIAQDRVGYLWLGTNSGLIRFDGFQFVAWESARHAALPGAFIPALIGARDGSLWAGFEDNSAVSRIRGDDVTTFWPRDGLPPRGVSTLLEDRNGTIWAGGRGGLAAFHDNSWRRIAADEGLPELDVFSLYEGSAGEIWVATSMGVFRRNDRGTFELHDRRATDVQSFAEDQAGVLWVTDTQRLIRALGRSVRPGFAGAVQLPGAGSRLLRDHHGDVWIAALGAGLFHLRRLSDRQNPLLERYSYESRFAGPARSLFEDREHNIWIGMRGAGLLRLSQSPIKTDVALAGATNDGVQALAATADGTVWVGTGHNLNRFSGSARRTYPYDQPLALHADKKGGLWVASPRGVGRFRDGRFSPLPIPASVRIRRTLALASDSHHGVWLCIYDQGLFRWADGVLTHFEDVPTVAGRSCNSLYLDSRDRMWIGFTVGGAAVFDGGRFRTYGSEDGLASGGIAAIYEDRRGAMWISTTNGLTRIANGQLTTVTGRGLPGKFIPSLVEDDEGYLWIGVNSGAAVMRLDPAQIDKVGADPTRRLTFRLFDESDGMQGPLLRLSRPTAVRAGDGRLWFVAGSGVAIIDPRGLQPHRSAVLPQLEKVTLDGSEVRPQTEHTVPPNTLMMQIDYGALSLSSASKLRFRYMLEGFSSEWQDAGARRTVSYTNLRPGDYRFRLAATADGAWTADEAVWSFRVQPPFYRTNWFYAGCVTLAIAFFSTVWWLRLRSVRNEFALIVAERARLGREIHDTLLQSLGAVRLQLEVASRQLGDSQTPARDTLQQLRKQVGQCIQDARQSVWQLRSPQLETGGLVQAFQSLANATMTAGSVKIRVITEGRQRTCPVHVEEHLLKIGQEAITNAIRHGHANSVDVKLDYRRDAVRLTVADNGSGFALDSLTDGTTGHWGLRNMRERATEIGGRFGVTSQVGTGTIVETSVPI